MSGGPERDERDVALEEVERALSVLGGRHPEQARAERLGAKAIAERQRAHDEHAAADRSRTRKRFVIALAIVGGASVAGFFGWRAWSSHAAIEGEVAPLVARYTALGFDAISHGAFAPQNRAEVMTVAGDCYALVVTRNAKIHVQRESGAADANGDSIVCTCASEKMIVTAPDGSAARALHIAGGALGGSRALAYRFRDRVPEIIAGDDACSDDALAAFARDKRYGKQATEDASLAIPSALAKSGFTTLATAPSRLPFVFVTPIASRCFIASSSNASDALTLWTFGESVQKPLARIRGAIAWCASKPASFAVERNGSGTLAIASAASPVIGGALGVQEIAARAGVPLSMWSRDDERGEIAADTLRASLVPDPVAIGADTIDATQTTDARVLVFSIASGTQSWASNDVDFRCDPPLSERTALCVQPRALTWRSPPPAIVAGAAYGVLPFWMSAFADVRDARVIDVELELLRFSRALSARGFSPSIIEGVTEKNESVEILGRSGEDAIIAVGLSPAPPYVQTYSDDVAWTLAGEPRVIPLLGGARVSLPVHAFAGVPLDKRRTAVFRHSS